MPGTRVMKAWLITWDWVGDAASVVDRVVGILNPRKSSKTVAEIVEFLYTQQTATVTGLAGYARNRKRIPYRAEIDFNDRVVCGHNPFLFAELVSDLEITTNPETGIETISWKTQAVYRPTEDGPRKITPPQQRTVTRIITGPISNEHMWDRSLGRFKNGFFSQNY